MSEAAGLFAHSLTILEAAFGSAQPELPEVAVELSVMAQTFPALKKYMMEEGRFVRAADGVDLGGPAIGRQPRPPRKRGTCTMLRVW